ncbi:MAG: sigma-70 family RNA polymerase sigma factor [Clostridia bacterium]|nr:sigma-70 family RNA polymerase sigma factor [Clostridia bacterium]
MIHDISQSKLINKAKNGDEKAFESLVLSCQNKAYAIAFRYMKNETDTLDVLQEAFIKMYINIETFSFKSAFETWFSRIVINCCYDALRKMKAFNSKTDLIDESEALGNIEDTKFLPESILLKKESSEMVLKALDSLPKEQRDVLILREYNHFSYFDISDILQLSEGTVKSRLNRAKLHLRDILTEQNPDFFV